MFSIDGVYFCLSLLKSFCGAISICEKRFFSDSIISREAGGFVADGELELKGMKREVAVPFAWQVNDGRAIMRGELVLRRLDFGIGVAVEEVGDDVRVSFEIHFSAE